MFLPIINRDTIENKMKNLKINNGQEPYEIDSVAFYKFQDIQQVREFLEINGIEDSQHDDYALLELLTAYGDVYYAYDYNTDAHAIVLADEETNQNWEIEWDSDDETYYVNRKQPAFWGSHWDVTIECLVDSYRDGKSKQTQKLFIKYKEPTLIKGSKLQVNGAFGQRTYNYPYEESDAYLSVAKRYLTEKTGKDDWSVIYTADRKSGVNTLIGTRKEVA